MGAQRYNIIEIFLYFCHVFLQKNPFENEQKIIKYQPIKNKILMKKCYNFLMVLATVVLCLGVNFATAQEPIFSEDFAAVTGGNPNNTNTQCFAGSGTITNNLDSILPGWSGDWVYPAIGKVKIGKSAEGGWLAYTLDLTDYESVRISFQAKAWNGSDPTTMTVYVGETAYPITDLPHTTSNDAEACDLADFSIVAAGGGEKVLRFESVKRIFLDNVVVTSATEPMIDAQGTTAFTNVPVNQEISSSLTVKGYNLTAGGTTDVSLTGDTQFVLSTGSYSNDELMGEEGISLPFTFSAEEAGNYTATISFTNNDLTDPFTVTLTATVISVNEITTIAALRALIDNSDVNANITDSTFYKYTGHAYVTQVFRSGSSSNQKWIQDETGAIQLYDPDGHLTNVIEDVEITNLVGKVCNYFGYTEFNVQAPLANADINAFPSNIPAPVVITLAQLEDQTYMDSIQGQLVKMENVTFNQTGTFDRYAFYTVTQNGSTDTAVYVTSNYDNIKGEEIPTTACNIIGVNMRTAAYSAGYGSDRLPSRYYILPKELEAVTGISENGKTSVSVYPNPTADNVILTIGGEATTVSVYNVMGTLVSTQSVSYGANTVNMNSMPSGVYFLRITNGNEAVGTVKVVRQ